MSFRNDYAGSFQEAVFVENGSVLIRPRLVRELKSFARIWDRNIGQQGFVEAAKRPIKQPHDSDVHLVPEGWDHV